MPLVRCFALTALVCLAGSAGSAERRIEFDFERGPLDAQWIAAGKDLRAARQPIASDPPPNGPTGHGLSVAAAAPGGVFTKPGLVPADLTSFERLEFWAHRSSEEAQRRPRVELEAQVLGRGGARFWRRVELTGAGWQKVSLPLPWFRWSTGRVPSWGASERLGLWLRGAAELQVDGIALVDEDQARGAALRPDDAIELAFAGIEADRLRRKSGPHVVLASDAPELDPAQLAGHLDQVAAAVDADLPELGSGPPAVLLVFGDEQSYRSFTPRLAERLGGQAPPPASDGFTVLGIATSCWSPRHGTHRPVYTHEFVHSYLIPRLGFDNHGDWLHEGLAVRYQLRFHPQPGFERIVRNGLADPAARTPLAALADGRPIPAQRYWQAATLVDLLLEGPRYAPRRAALFEAMCKAASADLGPHLPAVLGTDWAGLEADWRRWCEQKFGPPSRPEAPAAPGPS
jgi:hypothetical protein